MDVAKFSRYALMVEANFRFLAQMSTVESKKLIKDNIHYHSSWRKQAIKKFFLSVQFSSVQSLNRV